MVTQFTTDMTISGDQFVAIVAGIIVALIAPALLAINTARLATLSKRQDWARQDLVAARLEKKQDDIAKAAQKTADLLVKAQEETIRRTDVVAKRAREADDDIQAQLKQIHTLVNSDMTAARKAELVAVETALGLLNRVIAINHRAGMPISSDDRESKDDKETRIEELKTIIADRNAQMVEVEHEKQDAADVKTEHVKNPKPI